MTFVLFGLWQFYDTTIYASWSYGSLFCAFICLAACVAMVVWTVALALHYRTDFEKVPKKYQFILGDESFLPYQMPLRYLRKLFFCFFLFSAMIELQLVGMISANFLILAFYVIYKPSKSKFTNYVNILIEACYLAIELIVLVYINDFHV